MTAVHNDSDIGPTTSAAIEVPQPATAAPLAFDENQRPRSWKVLVGAIFIVILIRTTLVQPFTVPIISMEPTLLAGDYILVNKWPYGYSKYSPPFLIPWIHGRIFNHTAQRGDIVVFKVDGKKNLDTAKRIMATPGDVVKIHDGHLLINGVPVVEKSIKATLSGIDTVFTRSETLINGRTYSVQESSTHQVFADVPEITIPSGQYFVMGDNRDVSLDSRFDIQSPYGIGIGLVPEENLEGKVSRVLLSWEPGSSIWKPWTWFNLRWNRTFTKVQ